MLSQEIIDKLNAPLDPSRVKTREGPGGKTLSYLEGHDCVRTANEIFGVGDWGYSVQNIQCLGFGTVNVKDSDTGQAHQEQRTMYYATVELRVGSCLPILEVGFGTTRGDRPEHHEMAVKGAVTDGLKRCLKNYGDQFGLSLYGEEARTTEPVFRAGKYTGKTIEEVYAEDASYLGWVAENWKAEDFKRLVAEFLEGHRPGPDVPEGEEVVAHIEPAHPEAQKMVVLPTGKEAPADKVIDSPWVKGLTDLAVAAGWDKAGVHLKNHIKKHYDKNSVESLTYKEALALREHLGQVKTGDLWVKVIEAGKKAGWEEDTIKLFVLERVDEWDREHAQIFVSYFNALASGTVKETADKVLDKALDRLDGEQEEDLPPF